MTKKFAGAIALSIALGFTSASSATAAEAHLVKRDQAGDVKLTEREGLSSRARKSIDIRRVAVTDRAATTRIMIKVARLVQTDEFVQKFYVAYNTDVSNTYASYVVYAQAPGQSLIYHQWGGGADDFALCNEVQPKVRWATERILVDVPHECVPSPRGEFYVQSWTLPDTEAHFGWSWDRLRFQGRLRD